MTRAFLLIPLVLLAACASQPRSVVSAAYGERDVAAVTAQANQYFARDLAAALTANPGAAPFDYRFDDEDMAQAVRLAQAAGDDFARVQARYNRGRSEVIWNLCKTPEGAWRIADAGSADNDSWTLRERLDLPFRVEC